MTDDLWWWDSWAWRVYLAAYGEPWHTNFGAMGNLVIPLNLGMQSKVSKGHWAAIRKAERTLTISESFDEYREVHRLANGHVRSDDTFRLQKSWIDRFAFVLVASLDGIPAAAGFFVYSGVGSYYFSGPRNPNSWAPGAAHLVVWTAMERLRNYGVKWLDMGPLPDDDPKHQSIAHFKKMFGAEPKIWPDYV